MILHLCNIESEQQIEDEETDIVTMNSVDDSSSKATTTTTKQMTSDDSSKNRWSDVKKIMKGNKKDKQAVKGACLKIITSKMRCSIKVKEEFENVAGIY